MFSKAELERLRMQKQLLVLQSDVTGCGSRSSGNGFARRKTG